MGTTQDTNLANAMVYNFLIRNSFHEIASEFKETLRNQIDDVNIQDVDENDFKLENLAGDIFVRSLVYEFLRRKSHARVAFQYQLEFGPFFRDLKGLTLEKIFAIYKQKTGFVIPNNVCHQNPTINNTSNSMIPINSSSSKKIPFIVYDYLVRHGHFDVASELKQITGLLETDSSSVAKLEDMYSQFMKKLSPKTNNNNNNVVKIVDKEEYLKIVLLKDEFRDYIQRFVPKNGSQMDQAVLYLISRNLKTYSLSLKLTWNIISRNTQNYPWMSMRHYQNCKGGETEILMKNFEKLISKSRICNPKVFCQEIFNSIHTKMGHPIPETVKWKLIIIGTYLSKGLVKIRHALDVLTRVIDDFKSKNTVTGSFSAEDDAIIMEQVNLHGARTETWEKLCSILNRSKRSTIKRRYDLFLNEDYTKKAVPLTRNWSITEDKILIDCLFENMSLRNSSYVSSIQHKHIIASKANEKIERNTNAIYNHWRNGLMPLLLQYHQGTINTPWKHSLLQYIYDNKIMSASELFTTNIKETFPWLNATSASACFRGSKVYSKDIPLHEVARNSLHIYKDRPAMTKSQLERCEKIIQHYDPKGDLGRFKL